jgi:hypothetical protein
MARVASGWQKSLREIRLVNFLSASHFLIDRATRPFA